MLHCKLSAVTLRANELTAHAYLRCAQAASGRKNRLAGCRVQSAYSAYSIVRSPHSVYKVHNFFSVLFCVEHFVLCSWPACENAIFIFKHGRIAWWHLFYLLPRTCPIRHARFTWSTFSSSTFPFSFSLLGKVEAEIVMIPASFSLYWGGRDSFLLQQLERKVCRMVSWPRLLISLPARVLFLKLGSHLSPLGWCDCKSSPDRVERCVLWFGRGQSLTVLLSDGVGVCSLFQS